MRPRYEVRVRRRYGCLGCLTFIAMMLVMLFVFGILAGLLS